MYDRTINGEVHDFGVSGKLIMNVLVMYDRQTQSYWSQLLGEAIEGPLAGTQLTHYPSWQTTWGEWVARFPDTIALDKGGSGSSDTYAGYYRSGQTGIRPESISDNRLGGKEWVIGVEQDGEAVAYDFDTLNAERIVNDRVGETDALVVFLPESATGLVYNRLVDGQMLTFRYEDETLIDNETQSTWDAWLGTATSGPLEGQRMRRVDSTRSFWFGWKDWYPDTRIYGQS